MDIKTIERELTRHADDLQLYANGIAEDALGELDATADRIYALIAQLYVKYRKSGLQPDAKTVRFINDVAYLTQKQLEAISRYGIYNGNTRKQIFDMVSAGDADRIFDAMTNAVQRKLSLEEAAEAMKKEMEKTRRFVKTETDAVINGTANDANMAFAEKNKSYLIYCAVLDDKVCEHCASLDGEVYAHDDPELPFVPQHPNCRCSLWPVPEEYRNTEPVSFAEYIASLTPKEQKARLGKAKYDAWKRGEYTLRRYETPNVGQRLSMGEIRKRDEEALAKTNADFNPRELMIIISPITAAETASVRRYTCGTDGFYDDLNKYMRAGKNVRRKPFFDWHIQNIVSAANKSLLNEDITTYRGIKSKDLFDLLIKGGAVIEINSFQSTSTSKDISLGYSGNIPGKSILFEIKMRKKTRCLDVSKISAALEMEKEILLPPIGKYVEHDVYYDGSQGILKVTVSYEQQ